MSKRYFVALINENGTGSGSHSQDDVFTTEDDTISFLNNIGFIRQQEV